jgi:pimeloyl-ACP methyl ester carboxylesterase
MRLIPWITCLLLVLASVASVATPAAARPAEAAAEPCRNGAFASGALWRICTPAGGWNGDLVVYAHGYARPGTPLSIDTRLYNGDDLATLVQNLGYAFATTSYRRNGLAIVEGQADIRELVAAATSVLGRAPGHAYLVGASEGGLIATLLAEESPQVFDGALAACGPIGDFGRQIDYFGDFRVLFDYFFPGVIPPSPISVPQSAIDGWLSLGGGAFKVYAAVSSPPNQQQTQQLLGTAAASLQAPIDATNLLTGTIGVLSYNIYATNDATARLGGNPYDNHDRIYGGSNDDGKLNGAGGVQRFTAAPAARAAIAQSYQTSGDVAIPLVTIHTMRDEIVPIWHEQLYQAKAQAHGRAVTQITIDRTGHCNFTNAELIAAFRILAPVRTTFLPIVKG